MKRRITAALLTAILIISCFPSGVMTTVSRADDAKKENILTKISEDAVLKYNMKEQQNCWSQEYRMNNA